MEEASNVGQEPKSPEAEQLDSMQELFELKDWVMVKIKFLARMHPEHFNQKSYSREAIMAAGDVGTMTRSIESLEMFSNQTKEKLQSLDKWLAEKKLYFDQDEDQTK